MIPDGSGGSILRLEILADGTCWLADSRQPQSAGLAAGGRVRPSLERKLPDTAARAVMAAVLGAQPDYDQPQTVTRVAEVPCLASHRSRERRAFLQTLKDSDSEFYCGDLLDSALVLEQMARKGIKAPRTKALSSLLRNAGFHYLGRIVIDRVHRALWSRNPALFKNSDGCIDMKKIKDFVDDL